MEKPSETGTTRLKVHVRVVSPASVEMLHNIPSALEQSSPIWIIPFSQLSRLMGELSLEAVNTRHVDEDLGQAVVHADITI